MPSHGTLAITARGDGSRWYGRVSIPVATARAARLREGVRISARCEEGVIIIHADERGRIRFPAAKGKADPRHAFEAATGTLGLKDVRLIQSIASLDVVDGEIRIRVPEDCLAGEDCDRQQKKPRKEGRGPARTREMPDPPPGPRAYGTAATVITEARRAGKSVQPMTLSDVVARLAEMGQEIVPQGPRFFRLNGQNVTVPDLLDAVNKLNGSTEHDRIVLIVD